jgi:hypothetical protein
MNKRIRELAHEAGLPTYNPEGIPTKLEKFAELIVQECISSVGSQADKAYLKKHFGLPVESEVIYPATEESWSVKSQYNREYNFPK